MTSVRMWTLAGALAAAALTLVTVGCGGGGAPAASTADVERGHELFRKTCATCHGQDAEGMPRLGKNLHDNAFVAAQSEEELVEFLKLGRPATHPDNTRGVDMPPKGGNPALTEDEMRLIVRYMQSIS